MYLKMQLRSNKCDFTSLIVDADADEEWTELNSGLKSQELYVIRIFMLRLDYC